jgi:hypothetical protein
MDVPAVAIDSFGKILPTEGVVLCCLVLIALLPPRLFIASTMAENVEDG